MEVGFDLERYPALRKVVTATLAVWPEHESYCAARFKRDDSEILSRMNDVSELIVRNVGDDMNTYCSDYRWMCEEFLKEEIFFAREKRYRLATFQEAFEEVYSKPEYMSRYVRGILISQVLWDPHAKAFDLFRQQFLPSLREGANYLEIGPGHGLFLYFASRASNIASLEAWDVSASSIAATRAALRRLEVDRVITIVEQDLLEAPQRHEDFDAAVISEVLEHLEQPDVALRSLHSALRPGGKIFINVPINSPAPDHIYLWRSPEEVCDFVRASGFKIERSLFLPVTGSSYERAIRKNLSVSCIIIGTK